MQKPTVFYFNPTCELAVANGSFSYIPPLLLRKMESDLSILPFVFASKSDIVATDQPPSLQFVDLLEQCGFQLPSFCSVQELEKYPECAFSRIQPWGWSPAAHFQLSKIKQKCGDEMRSFEWSDDYKSLYERKTALEFLQRFLDKNREDWLIGIENTGKICLSIEDIEEFIAEKGCAVIKAPLSSSGRGIQIIRKNELNKSNREWISGVLNQQKYLIAEPLLDKIGDFSFHFEIKPDKKIIRHGCSFFETNSSGQYKGTYIRPKLAALFEDKEIAEFLNAKTAIVGQMLEESLHKSPYKACYQGFLGIDTLIFRENEALKMQPCIEINCRMNMGILTKKLEEKLHPNATGQFSIFSGREGSFDDFAQQMSVKHPLKFSEGRLLSGFLPLIEPSPDKTFGAYALIDSPR